MAAHAGRGAVEHTRQEGEGVQLDEVLGAAAKRCVVSLLLCGVVGALVESIGDRANHGLRDFVARRV